jgi:transposase-like protein
VQPSKRPFQSAKFWLSVLSELKGRGVADVCIVCCDGLTGLPDAIGVVWPQAVVQLCVVHLIRASRRYASRKYWAPLAKDLRAIYTAADAVAAAAALEDLAAAWGDRYPAIIKLWRAHWAEFTPFLAFPPEVRRVIYTTNLIESMNARLRKVTRDRGQFPSEQAALKMLYLAGGTWKSSAARTPGSAAPDGNKRSRHSRSTSTGESPHHENRHDHLHRPSDAPARDIRSVQRRARRR